MYKTSNTSRLVTMGLLVALEIILTRFCSINLPFLRIGFGFLPVAMMAIMYGPIWAGIGYAIGDLLGMAIFPSAAYFPGFTLTAFLTGIVFGVILHKHPITWKRVLIASLIVVVGLNLGLDTIWLSMLYGKAYIPMLAGRIIKVPIAIAIQTILIPLVWNHVMSKTPGAKQPVV
ncbi:MAG: folate family ECF transporter S component [Anaerovoracaceae bacterium]